MALTPAEREEVLDQMARNILARRLAKRLIRFHDLVDSESNPTGIRCDTPWCNAYHDPDVLCGDILGDFTALTHGNRADRAEARDAGEPYEDGVLP